MSNSGVREADRRRRDLQKEAFWREAVSRQRHSGLGVRAFCEGEGLKATAFYFWRREIGRRDAFTGRSGMRARVGRPPVPAFIELRPPSTASPAPIGAEAPIEVRLRHDRRVLIRAGCDAALLRQVLAVLEGLPC